MKSIFSTNFFADHAQMSRGVHAGFLKFELIFFGGGHLIVLPTDCVCMLSCVCRGAVLLSTGPALVVRGLSYPWFISGRRKLSLGLH